MKYSNGQVAALWCVVCHNEFGCYTPAAVHHIRKLWTSMNRDLAPRIPLCPAHHQTGGHGVALHEGEDTFEKKYGTMQELLAQTNKALEKGHF